MHRSFLSSTSITWSVRVLKRLVSAGYLRDAADQRQHRQGRACGTWHVPVWYERRWVTERGAAVWRSRRKVVQDARPA
jgi:hypothetical protein